MQGGGKGAMASIMEAAANVAASAKSGLDKTKAVVEEKVERMSTKDEVEKDMATLRKEEKLDLAELRKCKAYAQNAAAAAALPGAVTPNFTDGGGFNVNNKPPAAIIYSNSTDHVTSVSPASNIVVDSNVNPAPAQVVQPTPAVDYNVDHTRMLPDSIPAVDSNPNHRELPA